MKKLIDVEFHLVVIPKTPLGSDIDVARGDAKDIREAIIRHVDGVADVNLEYDSDYRCSFCDGPWTEKSDTYNGYCCEEDEKNNPQLTTT